MKLTTMTAAVLVSVLVSGCLGTSNKGSGGGSGSTPSTTPTPAPTPQIYSATWMSGSNLANGNGVYGTQNVASAANLPGSRYEYTSASDSTGNLWLFGGHGKDSTGGNGYLNDLWKYNIASGIWTWVSGNNTITHNGVYGTLNVGSTANYPGSRFSPTSWMDASGNFWLFGGSGYDSAGTSGRLNDLWRFAPSTGQWTWVSGSNTANAVSAYGSESVGSTANTPGSRDYMSNWIDASGNFWVFGGKGVDSANTVGWLNDLWKFNPTHSQWTWVAGGTIANASGVYGTKNVGSTANVPGTRYLATSWIDSSGNLFLFGGSGFDSAGTNGMLNDLWKFSPSTGQWTWVSGGNTANVAGVYGTENVSATSNAPGGRESALSFTDNLDNVWLFGGYGYDSVSTDSVLNDFWKFTPSTGQWTWIAGSNIAASTGTFGNLGVSSASNIPSARYFSIAWQDSAGNFWLFGGYGYDSANTVGFLQDLWKITP